MTQERALAILKTGANVFLTGEPGSGKSFVTRDYVSYLKRHGIAPAVTASTGIAATHIGGMTIHAWSGIGIKKHLSEYEVDAIASREHVAKRIRRTRVLIIDEVSMLDAATLDAVDSVCRAVYNAPDQAFGGMQIVLVGDFFQLPPIAKMGDEAQFAFRSTAWREAKPVVCYLSEQHRQEDPRFLEVLSAIRRDEVDEMHFEILSERLGVHGSVDPDMTRLFSHNEDVDSINSSRLGKIEGSEKVYQMTSMGNEFLVDALKRGCLSPEKLVLKKGAKVMFTKNSIDRKYVNGTQGVVDTFASNGYPIIRLKNDVTVLVDMTDWTIEDAGKVKASISQLPLRLAWAMTIHKSQGMSLDAAVMDLSQTFAYGQGYVALSRVRTLEGMYLLGINPRALQVHPEILEMDRALRENSQTAARGFEVLAAEEMTRLHEQFIRALGGRAKEGKEEEEFVKVSTQDKTRELIEISHSLEEIASTRKLTLSTILDHLDMLMLAGHISADDIYHLRPTDRNFEQVFGLAKPLFARHGVEKLKPVFDALKGEYDYPLLRTVRLFLDTDK
jgi:ATP-dependent DNA helicase PIF1